MSDTVYLPSSSRGNTNIGWLNGTHSFNFGNFNIPDRFAFGPLIILNDDIVQAGTGFGSHRHRNMEIISIPLSGEITHRDNKGNEAALHTGEIQLMTAGTGIEHSEYNKGTDLLNFLQIWITPEQMNVEPRYQQSNFDTHETNRFQLLISPAGLENSLTINQQAWLYMGNFSKGREAVFSPQNATNGLYIFIVSGEVQINQHTLLVKDALKVSEAGETLISFLKDSQILIIEVPLI